MSGNNKDRHVCTHSVVARSVVGLDDDHDYDVTDLVHSMSWTVIPEEVERVRGEVYQMTGFTDGLPVSFDPKSVSSVRSMILVLLAVLMPTETEEKPMEMPAEILHVLHKHFVTGAPVAAAAATTTTTNGDDNE